MEIGDLIAGSGQGLLKKEKNEKGMHVVVALFVVRVIFFKF